MPDKNEPSSNEPPPPPPCRVILLRREGGQFRFGLREDAAGKAHLPAMPFPNLLAIDQALETFARHELGLSNPLVHSKFVERPDPQGSLYYLVEARSPFRSATEGTVWMEARRAAERLGTEERKALARAIGYLSGQHFPPRRTGNA